MGKILKFRLRKEEKSPSLKDVTADELLVMYNKACDEGKQKNPKRYFGLEAPEVPEQYPLFACHQCEVTIIEGGEEVEGKNVLIKGFPKELHKKAKIRAVEEEKTFKKLVEDAVRAYLIRGDSKEKE